jgi:hypothetical protein
MTKNGHAQQCRRISRIRRQLWSTLIKKRKGKEMGKAIRASLLILLLACSAQAGYIPNDTPAAPPPSQQTSAVQEPTDATQDPTLDGAMPNDIAYSLTQTALDLLALLPSLL